MKLWIACWLNTIERRGRPLRGLSSHRTARGISRLEIRRPQRRWKPNLWSLWPKKQRHQRLYLSRRVLKQRSRQLARQGRKDATSTRRDDEGVMQPARRQKNLVEINGGTSFYNSRRCTFRFALVPPWRKFCELRLGDTESSIFRRGLRYVRPK